MPAILRTARASVLVLLSFGLTLSLALVALTPAAPARASSVTTSSVTGTTVLTARKTRKKRLTRKQRINRRVLAARDTAMRQRGDAYQWGGTGPHRFDCSGLIYFSYRRAGFEVPRTSSSQAGHTRRVSKRAMRPGDLMFFHGSSGVYHAAIFLRWKRGRAVMVHAPGSGDRVRVAYAWTSRWFGGTLRRR